MDRTTLVIPSQAGITNEKETMAESEGFEPPDLLQSTVFKTAAFDRSASSPIYPPDGSARVRIGELYRRCASQTIPTRHTMEVGCTRSG